MQEIIFIALFLVALVAFIIYQTINIMRKKKQTTIMSGKAKEIKTLPLRLVKLWRTECLNASLLPWHQHLILLHSLMQL